MANRPIIISIIALITIVEGILIIAGGSLTAFSSDSGFVHDLFKGIDLTWLIENIATELGATLLIVGIIILIVGVGLFLGWKFSWYVATIIYFITLIVSLFAVAIGIINANLALVALVPAIIAIVVIWYIFRPKVREFYGF
ncbi:MAG: hypothetical protein LBV63_02965 [Candidatus Methanoplasma sp.]|jgi:hypothetical protein|nr:hypothetical protein [Candidatus Methanoplasma sp.]